jgi:hypothetical protein
MTGKHRKAERRASGNGRRLRAAAMALALTAALLSPAVSGGFAAAAETSGLTRIRRISEDMDPVTEEEREARVFDDAGLFSDA